MEEQIEEPRDHSTRTSFGVSPRFWLWSQLDILAVNSLFFFLEKLVSNGELETDVSPFLLLQLIRSLEIFPLNEALSSHYVKGKIKNHSI